MSGSRKKILTESGNDHLQGGQSEPDVSVFKAEALEKAEALRAMVDNISQGISLFDRKLRLLACNDRFLKMFDYPPEMGRIGTPFAEFIRLNAARGEYGEGDIDQAVAKRLALARKQIVRVFERVRPNGRTIEVMGHPLQDGGFVTTYTDITERKRIERELLDREAALKASAETQSAVFDALPVCIALTDHDGDVVSLNAAWRRHIKWAEGLGVDGRKFGSGATYMKMFPLIGPLPGKDRDDLVNGVQSILDGDIPLYSQEYKWTGPDGEPHWYALQITSMVSSQMAAGGAVITHRDITLDKLGEDSLRLSQAVFQTTAEAIVVTDGENRFQMVNPSFTTITGYSLEEVRGKNPRLLSSGRQLPSFYTEMWKTINETGKWNGEVWNRRKSGEIYPEWLSVSVLKDAHGLPKHYVGVFTDITKRKQDEERIWYQANFDTLTGLPNRVLFVDRLDQAIKQAKREQHMAALVSIDLDRFKVINDTLGHSVGDLLLQEASRRLRSCLRAVDTVARLGGDEFTIVLPSVGSEQDVAGVAQKILESLAQPFHIDQNEAYVSGSIGIAIFPHDADTAEDLLKGADSAMYRAKSKGKNNYQFYTSDMNLKAAAHFTMEVDLRRAIERNELLLYYQPQIDSASRRIIACEALLRWRSGRYGLVSPGEFLPLAEETGLIVPIGEWVLNTACAQAKAWQDEGLKPVRMAVNISARQLKQRNLVETVARALDHSGLDPRNLEIEITESVVMENAEAATKILLELKNMGIRLAVDDFGTGYSSLSYLRHFPIDVLKIDRSFVMDLHINPDDQAIAEAIVMLAKSLNLSVTAEGVENEDQFTHLKRLGCNDVQGFLFSFPLPAEEFRNYLAREEKKLPRKGSAKK